MDPVGRQEGSGAIVGIQALRVLAAFMIAFHHFQHEAALLAGGTGESFAPLDWMPWTAGIDIFFAISGFIMVHASARLFGAPGAAREFLARRVTRIVPLYWLATTAFIAVALLWPSGLNGQAPGLVHVAASYFFIPVTGPDGNVAPVYSLGWTLNCEMFFYLLFALFIRFRREVTVLCVGAILVAFVLYAFVFQPQFAPLRLFGQPVMLCFVAGMVLGLACERGMRLPTLACISLVVLGVSLLHFEAGMLGSLSSLETTALQALAAILLVAGAGLGSHRERPGPLSALAMRLGDASYAIYLLHPFAGRLLARALAFLRLDAPAPIFFVGALALTLVLALVVHAVIEKPATLLLRARVTWSSRSKSLV